MARTTISALIAIASVALTSSAQAQDCPDLGASSLQICVVTDWIN